MFKTAPGVTIPFIGRIHEEYQVYEDQSLYFNISFEKLRPLIEEFYKALPEPLFIALHVPISINEERKLGNDQILHDEVLYLDGQTHSQIDSIMKSYGQILLNDGMSQFAISSHVTREEIFIEKYKITEIFSRNPRKYIPLLEKYGLAETSDLVTAWDTFSQDFPGECRLVNMEGLDIYGVADILKKAGMYRAKIVKK